MVKKITIYLDTFELALKNWVHFLKNSDFNFHSTPPPSPIHADREYDLI